MNPPPAPRYKLQDLIDIPMFQHLQNQLNKIYPFPSAIIDNEGAILTATSWQEICTTFYRKNKETEKQCIASDQYILSHLDEADPGVSYRCPHGLMDNAMPIVVDGVHYGNFFTGQFFLEAPDLDFFREQAVTYQFDEATFLAAVKKVPIWTREQLNSYLNFIKELIGIISESALKNLKELENRKAIEASKKRMDALIQTTKDGFWIVNSEGMLTAANKAYSDMTGYSIDELLHMHVSELDSVDTPEEVAKRMQRLTETGSTLFETKHRKKNGSLLHVEVSATYSDSEDKQFICFCRDITDRKASEETLRASEEKYRLLVENSNLGVFQSALDSTFLQMNSAVVTMAGYDTMEELMRIPATNLYADPADRERMKELLLKKGDLKNFEFVSQKKDGTRFWTSMNAVLKCDSTGNPESLFGIINDISERKRTETDLAERTKFIESIVNMTPDALYIYDLAERKNIYCNDGIRKILGYSAVELQAMGNELLPLLMHPDDLQIYLQMIIPKYAHARDNESIIHQYRMKHRDGEWRWLLANETIYLRNADGLPRQIFGMIHDITETKLTEEALRESEYFFKESQRAAKIGSYKTDFVAGFWESSEIMDQIFGIDASYSRSIQGWIDLVHPDDKEMMTRYLLDDVIGKRMSFNKEYRIVRKADGQTRWVYGLGDVAFNEDGTPLSLIGTIQDITDRKNTEIMLQNSQKLDSLGVLAGGIAHDFNNLMGGIFGYIDNAIEKSSEPAVITGLQKAAATIDRARALTQQLLTFAKGGAPVMKPDPLFPFVQETAAFALSGSNIECNYVIQSDLWICNFDRNQIGQVIDNIIINAKQAMPEGGTIELVARNVTLGEAEHPTLCKGNYLRISIKDHGIGIPERVLSRIFDPFFTTKAKGHGLGLATAYSIVNRHGGCIGVESEPGTGSTFHVYLPAYSGPVQSEVSLRNPEHRGCGTFLVMDDELIIQDVVGKMLTSFGYTVISKDNGDEAVEFFFTEIAQSRKISGAIFDLTVPGGMGGKAAVEKIRQIDTSIPIFVASGYAEDPVMKNPSENGFTASICKPFRKSELTELLNRYLYQETAVVAEETV